MTAPSGTPRRSWSWLNDPVRRARTESCARRSLPDLRYKRQQRRSGPVDIWTASVLIDHDEQRLVTVEFDRRYPTQPGVYADGPTDSPHRYAARGRTQLCLWLPTDKPEWRWQVEDGLLSLFGIAAHHLLKEAWWRQHHEWLGDEAPHGDDTRNAVGVDDSLEKVDAPPIRHRSPVEGR